MVSEQGGQAGQAHWVDIAPERLAGWIARFGQRHGGELASELTGEGTLLLTAADGETAQCHLPPGATLPRTRLGEPAVIFTTSAEVRHRYGLLLVRRGGFGIGVTFGTELITSKVDSCYVQGRTAAGGWSQQRFARRRANQTKASTEEAADVAARLLVPVSGQLTALVTGGDRQLVAMVLADSRLAGPRSKVAERFLAVPDPKLAVLRAAVDQARAVRIRVGAGPG